MKYLIVVALCVCASSAAQIGLRSPYESQYKPAVQAVASASVSPSSVTVGPFARNYQTGAPAVAKAYSAVVQPAAVAVEQPYVQTYSAAKAGPVAAKAGPVVTKNVVNSADNEAPILKSQVDVNVDGFNYAYETGNGIAAQEVGVLRKINNVDALTVEGSYQYQGPEGPVVISYIADENGYQPRGDVIPTPPPVPVAILRSLEWIASQPKQVETYKKL